MPRERLLHFRVGLFVVAALALLGVTLFYLGVFGTTRDPNIFYVRFPGSVVGLRARASTVLYRGVEIGMVERIKVDPANPEFIVVTIGVDPSFVVRTTMLANIILTDLTGIRHIELSGASAADPILAPESTLDGTKTVFEEIGQVGDELIEKVTDVLDRTVRFLDDVTSYTTPESKDRVRSILANVDKLTSETAELPAQASETLQGLDENVREELRQVSQSARNTLDSARELLEDKKLRRSIDDLSTLIVETTDLIREVKSVVGDADIEKLAGDIRSTVEDLAELSKNLNGIVSENRADVRRIVTNLRWSSENLREATITLRDNPSALIRSAPQPSGR